MKHKAGDYRLKGKILGLCTCLVSFILKGCLFFILVSSYNNMFCNILIVGLAKSYTDRLIINTEISLSDEAAYQQQNAMFTIPISAHTWKLAVLLKIPVEVFSLLRVLFNTGRLQHRFHHKTSLKWKKIQDFEGYFWTPGGASISGKTLPSPAVSSWDEI